MTTGLFSFQDTVHNHLSIGFVDGCLACAAVKCDLALSAAAYHASHRCTPDEAVVLNFPAQRTESAVSGNAVPENHRVGLIQTA